MYIPVVTLDEAVEVEVVLVHASLYRIMLTVTVVSVSFDSNTAAIFVYIQIVQHLYLT